MSICGIAYFLAEYIKSLIGIGALMRPGFMKTNTLVTYVSRISLSKYVFSNFFRLRLDGKVGVCPMVAAGTSRGPDMLSSDDQSCKNTMISESTLQAEMLHGETWSCLS